MIGFGARALAAEHEPKYLNTPQTPLFDKSGSVYGIDRAGEEARRADRIVVVEGYMDVIACHQSGIRNVVASMGTSITEKQMALRASATRRTSCCCSTPTRRARQPRCEASAWPPAPPSTTLVATVDWRGLVSYQDVLKADIRVVMLPTGEDPDSLVRADPDRLRALIEAAQPVADHLFEAVSARHGPERRARPLARARGAGADSGGDGRPRRARALCAAPGAPRPARGAHGGRAARRRGSRHAAGAGRTTDRHRPQRDAAPAARPGWRVAAAPAAAAAAGGARGGPRLDADVFEDGVNRRLFEAWRAGDDVASLDAPATGRSTIREPCAVDYRRGSAGARQPRCGRPRRVRGIRASIEPKLRRPAGGARLRRLLRLRRAQARLAARQRSRRPTEVAEARRGGLAGGVECAEVSELEAGLVAMDAAAHVNCRAVLVEQTTSYR